MPIPTVLLPQVQLKLMSLFEAHQAVRTSELCELEGTEKVGEHPKVEIVLDSYQNTKIRKQIQLVLERGYLCTKWDLGHPKMRVLSPVTLTTTDLYHLIDTLIIQQELSMKAATT